MSGEAYAAGLKAGMIKAMIVLHEASVRYYADAEANKKIAESEGQRFAARILQSFANGLEMEAEKLP